MKCIYCYDDLAPNALFCPRCGYSVSLGFPQAASPTSILLPQKEVKLLPASTKKAMDSGSYMVLSEMNDVLLDLSWQFVQKHTRFSAGEVMKFLVERVRPVNFFFSSIDELRSFCKAQLDYLAKRFNS